MAVRALTDGHHEPAQALAGNVYDSFLHDACRRGVMLDMAPTNRFRYRAGREVMEVLGPDATAADFLSRCMMSPMRTALEEFFPGQLPLPQYSRHATAHAASRVQYTPRNAVVAVMVMASVLRQAQESGW